MSGELVSAVASLAAVAAGVDVGTREVDVLNVFAQVGPVVGLLAANGAAVDPTAAPSLVLFYVSVQVPQAVWNTGGQMVKLTYNHTRSRVTDIHSKPIY